MIRAAVKIAYLGELFSGSQVQPGFRTVAGDVLSDVKLIMNLSEEEIDLKLASRTDKGVNALGNVAVFNSIIDDPEILLKALNAVSKGVFYRSVAFVDAEFNPRFADVRKYRYAIPSGGMDVAAMKECAQLFVGEHDFVRFCKPDGKSATLVMNSVEVTEENSIIFIDFSARYYMWNIIRRIVAAIAAVGRGDSSASEVKDALEWKDTTFGLAKPDALTLMDVSYKNIEFSSPPLDVYGSRIKDELFKEKIKSIFFTSITE
jgi:tRNA pseudouridine38-40 synthase